MFECANRKISSEIILIMTHDVSTYIYIQRNNMKTPDEYSKLINIEQQKLVLADTPEQKQMIQKRIQRLQFQKEIAVIRKKIEQLG